MFPNVYFIYMEYRPQVYKQTCYLFQYPSKVVTKTTDAKIKIGITEKNDKEILLVIDDVGLVANALVEKTSVVSWPPTINKLGKDSRRPPEIILNFY